MRVDKLLSELTVEEKCRLTAGADLWSTASVPRLGIPPLKLTDGPSGARGAALPGASTVSSACVPCGAALGATWDPALLERVGALLGDEARRKSARVLLAPTINLHRAPLAGRNFECYSEDPLLSGLLAAAFVRGVQSRGVAATLKHLVANETEHERVTSSSVVDDRTLRELYLAPFETAVREGGALAVMTAYNRLNGTYCAEHSWLVDEVLRKEWGFDGLVMTDWFAVGSTVGSAQAGLDLEMPGPPRSYGPALEAAVRAGEVDEPAVDALVRHLLEVMERLDAFADPMAFDVEQAVDLPAERALIRQAAASSMVLLQNDGVLPLEPAGLTTLAVIGPNAARAHILGGGSASLRPHYRTTPLGALTERLGDRVRIVHEPGCRIDKTIAPLPAEGLTAPDGSSGLLVELFASKDLTGPVVATTTATETRLTYVGAPAPGVPEDGFSARATASFIPAVSGPHTFTLAQAGRARLLLDGVVVLDGFEHPPPPGSHFFGFGSEELLASVDLPAGTPVELVIELSSRRSSVLRGVSVGCLAPEDGDPVARATAAAAVADAVVLVVGTSDEWESEGHDRSSMDLPGRQDELIAAVLQANPNTVVVVNAGSPVTMPWAPQAPAILQAWLGGQEMGNALADVLLGEVDPGGRLPMTLPLRLEHSPAYGSFPGENGVCRYGEGLFMGYRWYDSRQLPVRFPFGHGLSYTTFDLSDARVSRAELELGTPLRVEVTVTNTGPRRGVEVVQCYVRPVAPRMLRPHKELKAFAKVELDSGERQRVVLELDARAFACWDPGDPEWEELQQRAPLWLTPGGSAERRAAGWWVDAGTFELHLGRSSEHIDHVLSVTAPTTTRLP